MLNPQYLISAELLKDEIKDMKQYPFCLPVIKWLDKIYFHPKVTFLIGENGSGKSTLIEAIATNYGFNPEWWSKNFTFSTQQTHSELHQYLRIAKWFKKPKDGYFLRAESYYNLATNIHQLDESGGWRKIIDSYGGKSLHYQSHGESFFALFMNRFGWQGVYILDEPEAALSPQKQLEFLVRLHHLIENDSQFIIATHSPILLSYPDALILQIDNTEIIPTKYEQTQHYNIYRDFILEPIQALHNLGIPQPTN